MREGGLGWNGVDVQTDDDEGARLDGADSTDADFTNANWWRARGLTTKQIELLKKKFAPTATADPALKKDYAQWAGAGGPD